MKLLNLSEQIKGKVVSEIFFNDSDWVIKFDNGDSLALGIEVYSRKATNHLDGSCQVYSVEFEDKPENGVKK